ncbi:cGMP-dependent protein kinase 1 [Drosophila innubila]|uniref:cGMP-dependent protein kinase 1 n=1 Tax=Drosophila innubila TaxID=198719 RepID=UPI00148D42CE|nr:cGMP-dependent protein kinase 1 [Drosophila innubila]XP_034472819.1 cGMP-dependent protein kinase 1 [Drosophila innubila]XP_034472821.1 cGMP-dependent protein kinase 1 [Drosophila innubila]
MACFPRFFHHRSKNKFTPSQDENTDTILNTQDSPVQIGLYIRREEKPLYTPILTPNASEAQLQRLKQLPLGVSSAGQQLQAVAENVASTGNAVNSANDSPGNHQQQQQQQPKKFRSNKSRLQAEEKEKEKEKSGILNGSAINVTRTNSKLKPVKERRPTALPTEAPNVDDDGAQRVHSDVEREKENGKQKEREEEQAVADVVDEGPKLRVNVNGIIDESGNNDATSTPTTKANVKFFIGHTQELNAEQHNDDTLSCHSNDTNNNNNNNNNKLNKLTNGTFQLDQQGSEYEQQWLESASSSSIPIAPAKSYSNVSLNYLRRSKSTIANEPTTPPNTTQRRRVSTMPDIYIPPPPPMPVELLSPGTPLHLRKKRSVERQREQQKEEETPPIDATLHVSNSQDELAKLEDSKQSISSTTKLHRVEGGLIFVRPNLPVQENIEIEFNAKDEATRNLILNAIEHNDFLNNLMDKERKEMVINAMAPASYKKNSYIINEHDEGSEIYVSAEGYYDVIQAGQHVGSFGPATVFGELAILYNAPRKATIKAATDARVWKIARKTFRAIMQISGSKEREENLQFLRSAPFLQELEESMLNKVVDLLQRKFYETGSCIVREGEVGHEFFIIRGGTVTIKKKDEAGLEQVVAKRKRGDYFGEQALMNADVRQASVFADAPGTEVLKLEREAFISYLGTIKQLSERLDEQVNVNGRSSNRSAEFDNEYSHIALSDLKKVATLGSGAFGRVDLVTYSNQTFALKIIKKIEVIKQDQIEHVYNEKNVMIKCRNSPFIVQLYRTYRNEKYVYFLMEACMGGDVWTVMSKRQYFDDKTAKFIAGCVVEAFDFLHSHHFIYRDLKPENLMLTSDGYCKLVDFGFAKYVRPHEKTNTFAGTPEYVAPEIILDRGHDRAVDYWALGILIYELLVGKTPFRGINQIKIYQNILSGIDVIHMPSRIPKFAQNLIRHLCKQLPAERLGYQRKGIADIKRHNWFDNLDWTRLKQKQLPSPIKRSLKSLTDVQYFIHLGGDNDYEPPEELSGWDKDF